MSNITKIRNAMQSAGKTALLLTSEADRQYAAGFRASFGFVLILPDGAYFITDSRYIEAASAAVKDAEVLLATAQKGAAAILREIFTARGISEVGAQEESLSHGEYLRLETELGVSFLPSQEITAALRQSKEKYEVDCITAAQRIAEKALDFALGMIKPGITEKEIAAELEYQMTKNGADGLAFETICVSGENSSLPHGVPGGRKIAVGDFITMDFGCRVSGYCCDMTRTVALGHATPEMERVYYTVLDAQLAGIAALRAGIEGRAADRAAREVIARAGYGEYFGHALGHSVGLDIHEGPNLSPRETRPIPAGAIITCEPGIYLPGKFGVRIEDLLLVTETGSENLTRADKRLLIIDNCQLY